MDDDSLVTPSKVKSESQNKIKDGYYQLAEKMEQVKNQVAIMERKYDELYQTVKEREYARTASFSADQESPDEIRIQRESPPSEPEKKESKPKTDEGSAASGNVESSDENSPTKKESVMDIEKMEDNPFV